MAKRHTGHHGGHVPNGANRAFYHARFCSDIVVTCNGTTTVITAPVNDEGKPIYTYLIKMNGETARQFDSFDGSATAEHYAKNGFEVWQFSQFNSDGIPYKIINPTRATRRHLDGARKNGRLKFEYV